MSIRMSKQEDSAATAVEIRQLLPKWQIGGANMLIQLLDSGRMSCLDKSVAIN